MATANTLPPPPVEPVLEAELHDLNQDQALIQVSPSPPAHERMHLSLAVSRLPVELDVSVPVHGFRVRDLINLDHGQVIATQWNPGQDMPLLAGNVQLAWSEFEVVDTLLAVRVTRLA